MVYYKEGSIRNNLKHLDRPTHAGYTHSISKPLYERMITMIIAMNGPADVVTTVVVEVAVGLVMAIYWF